MNARSDHSTADLVSEREAAATLGELGLSREMARRALRAGVAGPGTRITSSVLYDAERVRSLLQPRLREQDLPDEMQRGTFLARAGDRLDPQKAAPTPDGRLAALREGWRFSMGTRIALVLWLQTHGHLPFVATVSGFVVAGAEMVDGKSRAADQPSRIRLDLRPPGAWYDAVHLRRLDAPAGGSWTTLPRDVLVTGVRRRGPHGS